MSIRSGMIQFHGGLEDLLQPIDNYEQSPSNYNNGDVEAISESIEVSGMYRPIFVQASTKQIIAGNHTWLACKGLGATEIPVVELDVDDLQAKKIMIADNRTASLARPDDHQLLGLLKELATKDDISGTGYTPYDLEVLEHLDQIPVEYDEFGQWPTISVQVPPAVRKAYYKLTEEAGGDDRARFELMLRLAGWDGS